MLSFSTLAFFPDGNLLPANFPRESRENYAMSPAATEMTQFHMPRFSTFQEGLETERKRAKVELLFVLFF